jgi:hypothetical protein
MSEQALDFHEEISQLEELEGAPVFELRRRFNRLERESDLEKRVTEVEKRLGIR